MDSVNYKEEGIVFDIQRFSLHDGPGIRTIVFLKGCPLSCLWCCNPESQALKPVLMYQKEQCIGCGKCAQVCKSGAIVPGQPGKIHREMCTACGECASICPTGALVLKGTAMTVEQVVNLLKKDATNYRKSGGGITISGGEPLTQWKFTTELLKACKAQGWHTAMETTGFGSEEAVAAVCPYLDLALADVKAIDPKLHKRATGVSNELIQKNIRWIAEHTAAVVRVPTIPTINANEEEFRKICAFVRELPHVDTIHILPYHTYGENKYGLLDQSYPMGDAIKPLPMEEAEKLQKLVWDEGLKCVIGG